MTEPCVLFPLPLSDRARAAVPPCPGTGFSGRVDRKAADTVLRSFWDIFFGRAEEPDPKEVATMKPPVRLVCTNCWQSVDLTLEGSLNLPLLCPICGGTIECPTSTLDSVTGEATRPPLETTQPP